jgi:DNA-binding MarR family transcriptional regulator
MSKAAPVPFETSLYVRDTCLCLHVQRTARALARRFDEALRALDLTSGQFSLLVSLNRLEPPSIGSVAALLAMDRTTLTAALKPLGRRGLVKVSVDAHDRRSRRLKLTAKGRALLSRALPIWNTTHAALETRLANADPARLRSDLHALSLGEPCESGAGGLTRLKVISKESPPFSQR